MRISSVDSAGDMDYCPLHFVASRAMVLSFILVGQVSLHWSTLGRSRTIWRHYLAAPFLIGIDLSGHPS